MSFSPLIRQMVDALRGLPGVGPKTAQRMALHLLERDRASVNVNNTRIKIGHVQ